MKRFFCVTHAYLEATNDVLRAACAARNVDFVPVIVEAFIEGKGRQPRAKDLLYRAATGLVADRVEKLLWRPGVAAF